MYLKFSELRNWKCEVMDISETDHDGIKEVMLNISGESVFGTLKFESGTHRVQEFQKLNQEEELYFSSNSWWFYQKHLT